MLSGMASTATRVRENRLRRAAGRQGLRLVKSRLRDPRALDHGRFKIVDAGTHAVVAGVVPVYGLSLDDVETFLLGNHPAVPT